MEPAGSPAGRQAAAAGPGSRPVAGPGGIWGPPARATMARVLRRTTMLLCAVVLAAGGLLGARAVAQEPDGGLPPPVAWARSGATGYATCAAYDRAAAGVFGAAALPASSVPWVERAAACGRAIHVLLVAARELAVARVGVELSGLTHADLRSHEAARALDLVRADRLVRIARLEARAEGILPPPGSIHLAAYVALARGQVARAGRLGRRALAEGDVPTWRALRLLAAVDLLQGNLDAAVEKVSAAVRIGSAEPHATNGITRALAAWIYDRAGDPSAVRDAFSAGGLVRNPSAVLAAAAMLPFHERLYLLALYQAHAGNEAHARTLFSAYLERKEPDAAAKALARRHLATLEALRRPEP